MIPTATVKVTLQRKITELIPPGRILVSSDGFFIRVLTQSSLGQPYNYHTFYSSTVFLQKL
jgi:hypothetical protein